MATAVFAAGSIVYSVTSSNRARRRGHSPQSGAAQAEFAVPDEYQKIFAQNMIIPAGWSFGVVWSTVYTGLGALLIHQALPTQVNNPRYQKALPWWLLSWSLNTIFGRFFAQNNPHSVVISDLTTKLNLPAALALHQSLEIGKTEVDSPEKYLRIPVSLYAGWLTAATVVGTPDTLLTLGWWKPNRQRDVLISSGILGATGLLGYGVARRLNDPWYMLPFVAGFSGIASRQWKTEPLIALKAASGAIIYTGLLAYWLPKGKFRAYEQTNPELIDIDAENLELPTDASDHVTFAEVVEEGVPRQRM